MLVSSNKKLKEEMREELDTRFENLTASQQQDSEVIDSRIDAKGVLCNNLKAAMDNNFNYLSQMQDIVYEEVEG